MATDEQTLFDIGRREDSPAEKKITVNVKKTTYERRVPQKRAKAKAPAPTIEERLRGGASARDEAIARVSQGVDEGWFNFVMQITREICQRRQTFASFDVMIEYERRPDPKPATAENRAFGYVMKRAQANGWCEPTEEFVPTPIREHHGAPKRVWRSLIFKGR